MEHIGTKAFNDCARLTTLLWQARDCHGEGEDTVIKYSYFFRCLALREVIIDSGVVNLPLSLVSEVQGLERMDFRGATPVAVNNMAAKSQGLRDVVLPPQMRATEHGAFYGTAVDTVILPDSMEIVGDYTYAYCDSLRVLCFGPKVRMVGNYSFTECSNLHEVTVLAAEPPDVQPTAFFKLPPTAVLYVPEQSLEAYRNHPVWGQFHLVRGLPARG